MPHSVAEKTGSERLGNLPKVTQQTSGWHSGQPQGLHSVSLLLFFQAPALGSCQAIHSLSDQPGTQA